MNRIKSSRAEFVWQAPEVFIALGSNLGNPRRTVLEARTRLEKLSAEPILRSSLWETEPVDCPPGSPKFVNAVVGLYKRPAETPDSLLQQLRQLEMEFGRKPKTVLNEARPLDLDLISFGGRTSADPRLTLPHPRAHARGFVLAPLSEIVPDLILPGLRASVAQLLAKRHPDNCIRRIG